MCAGPGGIPALTAPPQDRPACHDQAHHDNRSPAGPVPFVVGLSCGTTDAPGPSSHARLAAPVAARSAFLSGLKAGASCGGFCDAWVYALARALGQRAGWDASLLAPDVLPLVAPVAQRVAGAWLRAVLAGAPTALQEGAIAAYMDGYMDGAHGLLSPVACAR